MIWLAEKCLLRIRLHRSLVGSLPMSLLINFPRFLQCVLLLDLWVKRRRRGLIRVTVFSVILVIVALVLQLLQRVATGVLKLFLRSKTCPCLVSG